MLVTIKTDLLIHSYMRFYHVRQFTSIKNNKLLEKSVNSFLNKNLQSRESNR